jgi:hypothetical protein
MQLDHERLDIFELALDFLVQANGIIEGRGRSHLADPFTRASLSIVLNLSEGAGKHGRLDNRRYYLTARGSATVLPGPKIAGDKLATERRYASSSASPPRSSALAAYPRRARPWSAPIEAPNVFLRTVGQGHGHVHV